MAGTYTPPQMYDSELNPVKGWPSQYAVDKILPMYIEADGNFGDVDGYRTDFRPGMVVHIAKDTNGVPCFRLGIADGAVGCFIFQGGGDLDVSGDVGNITGTGNFTVALASFDTTAIPQGHLMGLVALGAYELETTEFVSSGVQATDITTYAPGVPITSAVIETAGSAVPITNDGTNVNPGLITNTTWAAWRAGTDGSGQHPGIIGTVSDGLITNERTVDVVRFWPEHLPCPTAA